MFNVKITFNPNNENIREDFFERRVKARAEFFNNLVEDRLIENLIDDKKGNVSFKVTFGGTQEFLTRLPELVYQFRVVDKKAQIKS